LRAPEKRPYLSEYLYPLTKEEALSRGYQWKDEEEASHSNDPSLRKCSVTGKPFQIIPQEEKFLNKMGLPLPTKCPEQRAAERSVRRNPHRLWQRKCSKTGQDTWTSYGPDRPEIILSPEAYVKEFFS
jgi:hypothetical protein